MSNFVQAAFDAVISDAKRPESRFVCLMESVPYYGGPEEGGWWGSDTHVIAFKEFPTEEAANEAKKAVDKLAKELQDESRKSFGQQCLREMEWLEARGLDADFLPEPDGESRFYVYVGNEVPESSFGCRHYE